MFIEKNKAELPRKIIHLSSMWIPLLPVYFSAPLSITIITQVCILVLLFDLLRIHSKGFASVLECVLKKAGGRIFRTHERKGFSGASYMMISAFFCILFFPKDVFISAFLILILADTAAALYGRAYGRHRVLGKTWEGFCAFCMVSFIVVAIIGYVSGYGLWHIILAMGCSVLVALLELLSTKFKLDDNLLIPIGFSVSFTLLQSALFIG